MEKKDVQVIKKTNAKVTRTGLYIEVWTGRGGRLLGWLSFKLDADMGPEYWVAEIVNSKLAVSTLFAIDYYDDGEMEIWADGKSWGNLGFLGSGGGDNIVAMRAGDYWSYWAFDGDTSTVAPLRVSSFSSRGRMIYYRAKDAEGNCDYGKLLILGEYEGFRLAFFAVTT